MRHWAYSYDIVVVYFPLWQRLKVTVITRSITYSAMRCDVCRRNGVKCAGCCRIISPRDLVRRAPGDVVYHVDCFACVVCGRRLGTGDSLYVLSDGRLICRDDGMRGAAPGAVIDQEADGMMTFCSLSLSKKCWSFNIALWSGKRFNRWRWVNLLLIHIFSIHLPYNVCKKIVQLSFIIL